MGLKILVAALAPLLIVALVAAPRPADASRPSSDGSGTQDAAPLGGLRRLAELVHSDDELEPESMRHRLLLAAKCPKPYSICGKSCANLNSDADNCGACGKVCGNNQQCTNGACTPFAAAGPTVATASTKTKTALTKCYAPAKGNTPRTSCYYDTKCSYNNCGGCGICCPWDAYCWFGKCICPMNKCLCKVYGKLKCLSHGEYCPQTKTYCCNPGYTSCATGCCPTCPDKNGGICQTNAGNVCCPTRWPGTLCYGPRGGRVCCHEGYWTGSTTRTCCKKTLGEKPTNCTAGPGDPTPPTICCTNDLPCRYNANPDPANPSKIIGYACISQTCAPPATIDPQCTNTTNELTDPPCCCTKCKAPYVPKCPAVNGILDKSCNEADKCGCKCPDNLWNGTQCCPKKKCGANCCAAASDQCYTNGNGQQACCPKSRWDTVSKKCCAVGTNVCKTSKGNVCCPSGTKCKGVPDTLTNKQNDVCCADDKWTGAPKYQCCANGKNSTQCERRAGDPNPAPKICCAEDIPCRYNENTDPATGKVIGYSCITQACPPPEQKDPHCTALSGEIENPFCCCEQCEGGWKPQCPLIGGKLDPTCDERNQCGCKCLNGLVDGDCCEDGTTAVPCPNSRKSQCCAAGEQCQWTFDRTSFAWERVCCKKDFWDSSTDTCCPTKVCNTRTGPKCCASPTTCKFAGSSGVCCTNAAWTGEVCCSGDTPAKSPICPDGSRICCGASSDVCYKDDTTNENACCPKVRWSDENGCCPEDRWTGRICCAEKQSNCNGKCVGPGTDFECCTGRHTDCPCVTPEGFVASVAQECSQDCCGVQTLCCDGKCKTPDDQNCAGCKDEPNASCSDKEECKGNTCVPIESLAR